MSGRVNPFLQRQQAHAADVPLASSRPVEVDEFYPELIWVGVPGAPARVRGKAEVVEDVQGLLPGVAGRVEIACGIVRVAEVAESRG